MQFSRTFLLCAALLVSSVPSVPAADASSRFVVTPPDVTLVRNFSQVQLVVGQADESGQITDRSTDVTHSVIWKSASPDVATVDERGRIFAHHNGETTISGTIDGQMLEIPVTVSGVEDAPPIEFIRDIAPVLSKAGCNMGACHAQQHGKGGFKLSVFGFDPADDREAIVRDLHQRRTNLVEPEQSLFLLKPTMQVPHGGGKRLAVGSPDFRLLADWVRNGAVGPKSEPAKVTRLEVFPKQRVGQQGLKQQLRVVATYADESTADVTAWALFDSMDEALLDVTGDGFVTSMGAGQAPVMVRFEGQAAISMFVMPYRDTIELTDWKNNNFVDELAVRKFQELGIDPSPLCDDSTFIRRAFLDATGTLPTVAQTKAFLASEAPDKRTQLVDELLGLTGDPERDIHNDNYAAWWTLKWSDLIRNTSNGNAVEQAMWAMHNWMNESSI